MNSICTTKGGQHANYIADKVVAKLAGVVKRKNKVPTLAPNLTLASNLAIVITTTIRIIVVILIPTSTINHPLPRQLPTAITLAPTPHKLPSTNPPIHPRPPAPLPSIRARR